MLDNQSRWFRVYGKREASRPRVNEKTRAEWFAVTSVSKKEELLKIVN